MAEGRMLKKLISTSKKLANLKTDSARLLYTWLIPHVDIKGRFSGEPDIVKGYIVPRLKTMDCDKIEAYLTDMAENDLIILYGINGDKYLEIVKFNEFQSLRKDRESPSRIPDHDQLQTNSIPTPGVLPLKRSEDKLSEANVSEDKGSEDKADSSFSQQSRVSLASDELKFYDKSCELFGVAGKSDRTTLQNVAKHLSKSLDEKVFDKAWRVAQECKKTGDKPIALFMARMKDELNYRSLK
jgi:hypothetical protein